MNIRLCTRSMGQPFFFCAIPTYRVLPYSMIPRSGDYTLSLVGTHTHTHAHITNTQESMTLSKLCTMRTVSSSECLAQAVVRWGLNRGLGTSLYQSEPQCTLCANCSPPLSTTSCTAGVVEVLQLSGPPAGVGPSALLHQHAVGGGRRRE